MAENNFDKSGAIKAMAIALAIALAGVAVLGWQYRQLEEKRLPALEEEIERQKIEIEKASAQAVLESFMAARIEGSRSRAILYLTENAVELERGGQFNLLKGYEGFRVLSYQKTGEESFRFAVEVYLTETGGLVESVEMIKIMDNYYVDSVELAG
jgi:hypothetical protein